VLTWNVYAVPVISKKKSGDIQGLFCTDGDGENVANGEGNVSPSDDGGQQEEDPRAVEPAGNGDDVQGDEGQLAEPGADDSDDERPLVIDEGEDVDLEDPDRDDEPVLPSPDVRDVVSPPPDSLPDNTASRRLTAIERGTLRISRLSEFFFSSFF
jgi:hypothetical protein